MYVYRFIDSHNKILYIGKTVNMGRRMKEHFSEKGHLPRECYKSVAKIDYMKFNTEVDSLLAETYFINIYKPPFNKLNKTNSKGDCTLVKIKPNFKVYKYYKPVIEYKGNKNALRVVFLIMKFIFWWYLITSVINIFN